MSPDENPLLASPASQQPPPASAPPPLENQPAPRSTTAKLLGLLVVIVCFEVGVFLLVFPWMDAWSQNWFASQNVWMMDLFESNYFRGALSGLGAINIYISFAEMMRLLRGV
jgi:hypothetical protein